ncbi:hypothetical protein [Marinobacter mangrovi]|uniref:hypothetical protein n=1 Tax=Marinobacter mangrovi TaxID=2803918 RepID=UPI0019312009|nr:hypothetical protein [Marinobacter mangrovi]
MRLLLFVGFAICLCSVWASDYVDPVVAKRVFIGGFALGLVGIFFEMLYAKVEVAAKSNLFLYRATISGFLIASMGVLLNFFVESGVASVVFYIGFVVFIGSASLNILKN